MTGVILAIVQSGITKSDICVVIFVRIFEIGFPFYIIALCPGYKELIDNVLDIIRNQCSVDFFILYAGQCVCDIRWIGERTDL